MKYIYTIFILVILLVITSSSIAQTDWEKYAENPVLAPGPTGAWDPGFVSIPSVLFDGSTYHMWYNNAVNEGLATKDTEWFPDAKRTLTTLKEKGYKLGLISNTHWRISESLRKEFKKFFDAITFSYEHGYAKPHPSIFTSTLEKLRISTNHCLHVGDDPIADIQGAKNIGMKTAFILRREIKTDADIEIKQLIELTTLL